MDGLSVPDLFAALQTIVGGVGGFIAGKLQLVEQELDRVFGGIFNAIEGLVAPVLELTRQLAGVLASGIANGLDHIETILGDMAELALAIPARIGDFAAALTDKLGELPEDTVKAATDGLPAFLLQALFFLLEHGDEALKDLVGDPLREQVEPLARFAERVMRGDIKASEDLTAGSPRELQTPLQHTVWGGIFWLSAITALLFGGSEVPARAIRQELNIGAATEIPPVETLVQLDRRGEIAPEDLRELALRNGWDVSSYNALRTAAGAPLPPGQVLDLYNRLLRPGDFLKPALDAAGVRERDQELLAQLADFLPPVSDILTFLTRDNFNPEIVAAFGQEAEFGANYEAGAKLFQQLGVSREVALEYWKAHWQLPSLEFGYRMFQRTGGPADGQSRTLPSGATVNSWISHDTLQRLHRAHGIEPFWREAFLNIAFNPLTRVDVRRIRKAGLLDEDGVARAYMDLGYNDQNAALLAKWVETQIGADEASQVRAIRAPIEGQILATYRKHYLGRDEADALLRDLAYTDAQRAHLLATADLEIARDYATEAETAIRASYTRGHIDATEARDKLTGYGFKADAIGRLLGVWDIARAERELSAEESQHRALSRSEIVEAYVDHILTRDQAGALLVHAVHKPEEVDTILALADARQLKAETAALVDGIHARYVAGKISPSAAGGELDGLHVSARRREALLGSWDLEKLKRESRLSADQVRQLIDRGIVTEAQAATELRQAGYGDQEIGWLLRLWGPG